MDGPDDRDTLVLVTCGLSLIDIGFDVSSDTPPGRDPDSHSPTLREYHRLLWSKPLPDGTPFILVPSERGHYLLHESVKGRFSCPATPSTTSTGAFSVTFMARRRSRWMTTSVAPR